MFNTKDGGPKHWKILHETPNQTVIGPLWDPQYYFTAGKRWQPQLPETWSYLDLEKIGARVPDDQFKGFLSFMSSEELKLNTYESVWPWLFSPAPGFLEQLPPTQLGLFTPNMPALRQELEVEKLAKKQQMEHAIRTSLALFNDNLPYIENYIRKTLGITDPQGVAAEVQRIYNEAVARHEAKLQDALVYGSAIADYDEEFAAATEFIDNIKQLTTPEEIAANSQRVWNTTMANFGQWVDNAPKGWTEAELAGMQAAEAQKAAQAEDAADWAEWEQGMAQRAAEVEAARVPGNGTWQVIDRWDEVTTLDVDGKPMTVYPQTRIAPASFKPLEYRGKGAPALTEEEVQDAITRHNWLTSGPSGEFTPVSDPTGSAQPAGPRRKTRWDSFWKNSGDLPGAAEDGSITMGGGFGAPAPTGAQPDFTGGLSKEDRATIRAINDAINSGSRKFADLSDEEWELMFRGWENGPFNYPKTAVGWPEWAIERREKRVDYDGWVRGKSPRKMPVVRPFNPNASEVDLGRTARISTGDLSAALQSTDQKRGVYATERTQILDVVQQPNGQYVVVTHDGMFVRAYVMDDVRPELLKTDKVTTLKKGQALGIGAESPFERSAWMGEHGIMDSIGASFSNASPGSPRGAQEGYLPKTSRASQAQSLEGPQRLAEEDEEELTPIQRLQGTTGEQEPPPVDRSLTPGQRLRLKNLGYSDDQMIAMTPERRSEVLSEGIDAADAGGAYGAGWLGGQPTVEDVAATGAGPTGGYRVPAEPNTDRFGWTMRLRNDQGMSEVGLVVDQAERGGGTWYRVRTRNGSEHWVSSTNAQFVTPATGCFTGRRGGAGAGGHGGAAGESVDAWRDAGLYSSLSAAGAGYGAAAWSGDQLHGYAVAGLCR